MTALSKILHVDHHKIPFTKMHGCGNDYLYINGFENEVESVEALSRTLSDRHFGIGGDGLVLILPSKSADAKMRMFNQDGSEGMMCGNAIRCVAKYLYDNNMVADTTIQIETQSGIKTIEVFLSDDGLVASAMVDMGQAELDPALIPTLLKHNPAVSVPLIIDERHYKITCVSMGNPHTVIFCDNPNEIDLPKIGPTFEKHPLFPEGTNTEFVKVVNDRNLSMRVWERGSGETLACGTGACASAVAAILNKHCKRNTDILIHLKGGELTVRCTNETVFMTGACSKVFEGTIDVDLYTYDNNEREYQIREH